jgi:hypothetical protein
MCGESLLERIIGGFDSRARLLGCLASVAHRIFEPTSALVDRALKRQQLFSHGLSLGVGHPKGRLGAFGGGCQIGRKPPKPGVAQGNCGFEICTQRLRSLIRDRLGGCGLVCSRPGRLRVTRRLLSAPPEGRRGIGAQGVEVGGQGLEGAILQCGTRFGRAGRGLAERQRRPPAR